MSGTILLADDSLTIQKVVELTFADTDYRVVAVSSGDELLERLAESQPDLIICDVIMPGRDGYDICQRIKSSAEWLHLPVILLTGTFEPFDRDRAIAAGCSEIITKPFEARKLVDTVERLIGGSDVQTPQAADPGPSAVDDETRPEDATPAEVRPPEVVEEFGTQLSAPATGEDGIEFTTSGFAEMEAAGRTPTTEDEPDDGLDYEFGSADVNETEPTTPSAGQPPSPTEDVSAQTVRIDVSSFAKEETPEEEPAPPEETETEGETETKGETETETETEGETETETDASAETAPGPFEADDEEAIEAASQTETEEEPEGAFKDETSMADTSPVEPPPEDTATPDEIASDEAFQLTEEDIDRIARRVVDLAADRLDQIAWEVVPDVAEIVVRQRVRELEAESEASAPDSVQ